MFAELKFTQLGNFKNKNYYQLLYLKYKLATSNLYFRYIGLKISYHNFVNVRFLLLPKKVLVTKLDNRLKENIKYMNKQEAYQIIQLITCQYIVVSTLMYKVLCTLLRLKMSLIL